MCRGPDGGICASLRQATPEAGKPRIISMGSHPCRYLGRVNFILPNRYINCD